MQLNKKPCYCWESRSYSRNTLVQLFALYTNPECHSTQCWTDTQTEDIMVITV